jgi:hypothetical protein
VRQRPYVPLDGDSMTEYTCSMSDCDTTYVVERGEDSLFVSFSISPHDVADVEKRAVSLCAECAKDVDVLIPEGDA